MNDNVLLDWLLNPYKGNIYIKLWFLLFCILLFILLLNLFFCVYKRFSSHQNNNKYFLFFCIHIIFGLVLICHSICFFYGFKMCNINVLKGQSLKIKDKYILKIERINFVDDIKLLKMNYKEARKFMSRENFHRKKNFVSLKICGKDIKSVKGKIYILEPFEYNSIYIILNNFILLKKNNKEEIGAHLSIVYNPFVKIFFFLYGTLVFIWISYILNTFNRFFIRS